MAAQKETAEQIVKWLTDEWSKSLAAVVESMADHKPSVSCDGITHPFQASEGAHYSEQAYSLGPACLIRLATPEPVWRELGTSVLKAAGVDEVSREDALSTYQEVLGQSLSGIAQALSARLGEEVTCGAKADKDTLPEGIEGLLVSVTLPDTTIGEHPIFIATSPEFIEEILRIESTPEAAPVAAVPPDRTGPSSISKTFDLLLGVHLPVSISFGRTNMLVKEVLKLTTGSIVELDRQVTEPVDIIVNNCIIARGEVVVVGGNYGVRVKEIVSREQRYETGARVATAAAR